MAHSYWESLVNKTTQTNGGNVATNLISVVPLFAVKKMRHLHGLTIVKIMLYVAMSWVKYFIKAIKLMFLKYGIGEEC